MSKLMEELWNFLSKWWVYLFYIIIGIVGKFSWELTRKKRITFVSAVSTVGISGFVGYVSSVYCYNNGFADNAAYVVPICTLLSDKILTYIIYRVKWKEIRDAIFITDK